MKLEEIKPPVRSRQYWISYWDRMNGKLKYNHFNLNLYDMREEILEEINMTISPEEMNPGFAPYAELQDLLKQIDEAMSKWL